MHLSEAKTKRLLIEGRWYSTKETRAVRKLMRSGKTDEQIAEELGITTHQVRTLKPYKDSRTYGIGTASAQKSRTYRRRKNKRRKQCGWISSRSQRKSCLYAVFHFGVLERLRKFDDILEIKYQKLQLRLLFLCYYGRKLDDKNARKLRDY